MVRWCFHGSSVRSWFTVCLFLIHRWLIGGSWVDRGCCCWFAMGRCWLADVSWMIRWWFAGGSLVVLGWFVGVAVGS